VQQVLSPGVDACVSCIAFGMQQVLSQEVCLFLKGNAYSSDSFQGTGHLGCSRKGVCEHNYKTVYFICLHLSQGQLKCVTIMFLSPKSIVLKKLIVA